MGVNYKFTMHNINETNWNGKNILSGHAVSCKSTKCMPKWNMASIQYKINPDEFNKMKYLVCHNLAKSIAFIGHLSLYVMLCLPHLRVQLLSTMTAIVVVICQWHKPPTRCHCIRQRIYRNQAQSFVVVCLGLHIQSIVDHCALFTDILQNGTIITGIWLLKRQWSNPKPIGH